MFGLFKRTKKPELDSKSRHIAVMYLSIAKNELVREIEEKQRTGESEVFTAEHDIKCLEKTIKYLGFEDIL
jgi:hypothetical protein